VLVWEAPRRVVLVLQLSAQWQFDPSIHAEVDVRFIAIDDRTTRVDSSTVASKPMAPTQRRCATHSARRTAGPACSTNSRKWPAGIALDPYRAGQRSARRSRPPAPLG
jgi:hypothetical protein